VLELTPESLANGGPAVARTAEGEVVLIDFALPHERLRVELDRDERPLRGRVLEVLAPSGDRVPFACEVGLSCGGCDWIHVSAELARRTHEAQVVLALSRALHVEREGLARLVRFVEAPLRTGYRERARLVLERRGRVARLGHRGLRSRELCVPPRCEVLAPELAAVLPALAEALSSSPRDGELHLSRGRGGLPALVLDTPEASAASCAALARLVDEGRLAGAQVRLTRGHGPPTRAFSFGEPAFELVGHDGLPLLLPPAGFAQTSSLGASLLAGRVAHLASLVRPSHGHERPRVLELFAGSGTLSIALAPLARALTTVELEEEAVACARQNLRARGLAAKLVVGDAEQAPIDDGLDVVVLDPPRAGARAASLALARARPRSVVYVSCEKTTLARDLAVLVESGLELSHLELVELFPQTSHVEVIARLERPRGAGASTVARRDGGAA
jgi:23S rRNA (uracil1939-C5)-methyltransferase